MDNRNSYSIRAIAAIVILSCMWIKTSGQLLVPVTSPGATPKPTTSTSLGQSSCNYLVSRTNGVCMVTTTAVQSQLNAIKDDNFRARLQFMSQNSVLQTQISQIESDDVKLSLRVDGLQRDLQALRSRLAATGSTPATGTGTGNANVNQLRTTLQQSIQGVDNRVTGLAAAYQRDAVSQAQTNAAFQQQLTQLLQDNQQLTLNNNRLTQELQRLDTQVQALTKQCAAGCGAGSSSSPATTSTASTSSTSTTTPAPTAAPINSSRIAKLERDILNLDNLLQQTNADLSVLDRLVTQNHTQEIRNAQLELRSHDQRIRQNQQDTNTVYQALQILNKVTVPNMQADINVVKQDTTSLKTLTSQLEAGQKILLNDTLFMKLDVAQLQKDVKGVQTTQGQHRKAIDELNTNLVNPLKAAYPQLSTVQTNVVSILSGGTPGAPSTTKGSIVVPPTLNPPVSGPTTPKAATTGGAIIVPPTLPSGNG
ncbi:hypothetical protein ElyMa_001955300 [Elysia marginata]|uniref:Uncharacterized protein n=1 Tax=Elysia marginata TaxID=1093978 RepID=A0AAV4EYN7_9GAST|nr:hypothetical protein ElyMa_001955300 [Elysia marginata]